MPGFDTERRPVGRGETPGTLRVQLLVDQGPVVPIPFDTSEVRVSIWENVHCTYSAVLTLASVTARETQSSIARCWQTPVLRGSSLSGEAGRLGKKECSGQDGVRTLEGWLKVSDHTNQRCEELQLSMFYQQHR